MFDACFEYFFYQDELKKLKNIERSTSFLKELGLWEYAPKKPKGKGSRKHTVSLNRKQQPCWKGNNGMDFFTLFHLKNFNFQIYFDCQLRQRLTMNSYCLSKSAMPGKMMNILQSKM